MKPKTIVAVILISLGAAAFAYQAVLYATAVGDVGFGSGPLSTGRPFHFPLLAIFGAIGLIGGIALLLVDKEDFKREATP